MATIYMKIYNFDSESQGIEVAFASSETASQNPDDYTRYNFDTDTYCHCESKEDLVNELLQSGASICESIKQTEHVKTNTTKQTWFTELAGTTHSGTTEALVPQETYEYEVLV